MTRPDVGATARENARSRSGDANEDHAALGIGRAGVDAGTVQGRGIECAKMSGLMDHGYRQIPGDGIEVVARGGYGSPTIFVDGADMYFGNDQLPLVEAALLKA